MKKILGVIIAIVIIVVIVLLATNFTKTQEEGTDNSLNEILEKGELVLGMGDSIIPMGFTEDNETVGFDIDLAKEVTNRLGVNLKIQTISWASKEQELNSGNIDCIWNGLGYTEERAEIMNLTDSYVKTTEVFVVKGDSGYNNEEDLVGKAIGVHNGSTAQMALENSEYKDNLVEVSDFSQGFMDLDIGGLDALCIGNLTANYLIKTNNKDYRIIPTSVAKEVDLVVGFRKEDQQLRDKVQEILYQLKDEGKLAEISTKWFGEDITCLGE